MSRKDVMTRRRCEVVLALADCNMSANAAGSMLYMDHSCVEYHIKLIKKITGLDPKNFYDLAELVCMVKEVYGDYYDL